MDTRILKTEGLLLYMLIFLITTLIFSCSTGNKQPDTIEIGSVDEVQIDEDIAVSQKQYEMAGMQLGSLEQLSFPSKIYATGKIEIPANNKYKVGSIADGYVRSMNLRIGQEVRKGQVLFTLENPKFVEMQQEYLEIAEQMKYLESDYERQKLLASENVASQKSFMKAASEYQVTKAKLEGLKKRLSLIQIDSERIDPSNMTSTISVQAPASGYISALTASRGTYLGTSDIALEMVDVRDMFLDLYVFEKDVMKVKKGQKIRFELSDDSEEVYEAEVELIAKMMDTEKRVVQVRGSLKNTANKAALIVGMQFTADIIVEDLLKYGLPETAIVSENGQEFILKLQKTEEGESAFRKIAVKTGAKMNGQVEILNATDLEASDQILINGGFNLIGIE